MSQLNRIRIVEWVMNFYENKLRSTIQATPQDTPQVVENGKWFDPSAGLKKTMMNDEKNKNTLKFNS